MQDLLLSAFAVSRIVQRCWLPSLLGFLLAGIGYASKITWVVVIGLVLAAPII